ncbi:MAG: hypothetical protein WB677_21650 [Xanthobacteraceae bacterium]
MTPRGVSEMPKGNTPGQLFLHSTPGSNLLFGKLGILCRSCADKNEQRERYPLHRFPQQQSALLLGIFHAIDDEFKNTLLSITDSSSAQ